MSMKLEEVMAKLESLGTEQTRKTFKRHGAPDNFFGVKIGDLKPLQKKIKKDHDLSKALYDSGNSDAMYLAGLIADETKLTKADLNSWAKKATWYMLNEYTVAWVAAESNHAWELAKEWIESKEEKIACGGWATYSSILSIAPNENIDIDLIKKLLDRVAKEIHGERNRVRYTMNGFVIACGCWIPELNPYAKEIAKKIGKVDVNVGDTACKVPLALEYIIKVEKAGRLGNKKKTARC